MLIKYQLARKENIKFKRLRLVLSS